MENVEERITVLAAIIKNGHRKRSYLLVSRKIKKSPIEVVVYQEPLPGG